MVPARARMSAPKKAFRLTKATKQVRLWGGPTSLGQSLALSCYVLQDPTLHQDATSQDVKC